MFMQKKAAYGAVALMFAVGGLTCAAGAANADAPPAAAASDGVVVKTTCKPDDYRGDVTLTPETVYIRESYYAASRKLVALSKGTKVGRYGSATNSYGHLWYKVQYSSLQRDWCGWVSHNWAI